ncbi:hypothetical protein [uncultured Winogradskyella sp.]|uniref:hypothetical protein n=1 Tax=uncultured Winogradskyella sp. TaxID=395353 RepID=UPI00351307DA
MKNYIIFGFAFALIGSTSFAQTSGSGINVSSQDFFQSTDNYFVRDRSLSELSAEGSPYINEKFETAKFKRFGNRVYNVRFNAYLGDIEVQTEKGVIALNKKQDFEVTFLQSNKMYKNFDYNENGNLKRAFFVVIYSNGNYSILKREKIRFRAEEPSQTGYDKGKPAAFLREDDTFYLKTENSINEIPTRKRKFLSEFSDSAKGLKAYMKKNDLDVREENDLVELVKYIMDSDN